MGVVGVVHCGPLRWVLNIPWQEGGRTSDCSPGSPLGPRPGGRQSPVVGGIAGGTIYSEIFFYTSYYQSISTSLL